MTEKEEEPVDHWLNSRQVDVILGFNSAMSRWRAMRFQGMPRPVANILGKNRWSAAQIHQYKADREREYAEGRVTKRQPPPPRRKRPATKESAAGA
jgi:hypothetical protein